MPILTLTTSAVLDPDARRAVTRRLVAITADRLGKQPDVTVVQIIDNLSIMVGPGGTGENPVFALTIRVTQGTNTKSQVSAFQTEAHAVLTAALGAEAGPNYVVVEEVPAANWGFGGRTQEARAYVAA